MNTQAEKQKNIILSVQGVVNRFGKQVVHDGVNLDVFRGEILGIVGGSGSGKSVLLKTMIGLREPNAGHVTIKLTASRLAASAWRNPLLFLACCFRKAPCSHP